MSQPQQINVDLNKCPDEFCECGSPFWKQKFIIKRIPGIMAASTNDIFQPANFFACEVCEKPHRSTGLKIPEHEVKGSA